MPRKTTPTLMKAADEFYETRATYLAPTTLANETSVIRTFVRGIGEQRQCHTVTQRQVELWFAAEAKRQAASSYNKVRSRVTGFVQFCQRRGWIESDLMGEIRALRVVKRERMRLNPAELLALPDSTTNERDRILIAIATNTALRAGSIVSIRVGDVDLANGSLRVTIHKSSMQDDLPITAALDTALRRWMRAYEADAGPLQGEWYLVPRRQPGHGGMKNEAGQWVGGYEMRTVGALQPEQVMRNPAEVVQRALKAQGHAIARGEGVHTLRRSVARAFFDTLSDRKGYDTALRDCSALLHHAHSHTTEGYLGLSSERRARDRALRGQPFLEAMVSGENVTAMSSTRRGA